MWDEPQVAHLGAPFQYLSWCNVEQQENALLIPCGFRPPLPLMVSNGSELLSGPGDTRDPRVLWLGSDSGW